VNKVQTLQTLLEITAYSAVLFLVTMLLKRVLKEKLSPTLHYAIWSLFLLRLIVPVTLTSPVQLITLPPAQPAASAPAMLPQEEAPPPAVATDAEAIKQPANAATQTTQGSPAQIGFLPAEQAKSPSIADILVAVWLGGVALGFGYLAFLYLRLQARIRKHAAKPSRHLRALYQQMRQELGIQAKVPLVCQYGMNSPGILFPARVLMPMELLCYMDDEQIKNTLRHELIHYKRGDHIASILLSLLTAVYWFNPIVWVAAVQIRADVETVCDSLVVRAMSAKQKGDYATLILDLFSRSNYRQVVLGMAYGKSKAVVEKRIKGVFMRNSSQQSAKIICFALALVMLFSCFTTACVPRTQSADAAAIIGGADEETSILVSNGATPTPAPSPTPASEVISPLATQLGIPSPWRYAEWSADKKLLLNGKINVTLPNVDAVPIASATCRDVTKADLMNAIVAFFGEEVRFVYAPEDTKEYAEAWLAQNQEGYDSVINGTSQNKIPSFIESVKQQYALYSEAVKTAPSAAEKREVAIEFVERKDDYGESMMSFRGVAEHNGTEYLVRAGNSSNANTININELHDDRPIGYLGTYRETPEGVSTTKEQAIEFATAMAAKLDSGLTLSHVMTVGLFVNYDEANTWEHPWAWQCVFMRQVNGVGTVYDSRDVGTDIDTNILNGRTTEALEITVDDRGICDLRWVNPMTIDSIATPAATLLLFSQIETMLPELLREKYDYNVTREEGTLELFFQRAELGLMRIGKPGSVTYTLEPVWSFFLEFEENPDYSDMPDLLRAGYDGDPAFWNSLTISAIDGRVIDRDRGY
jgi:beta-lactamase regulating signal transducer with metallopeptidase domain